MRSCVATKIRWSTTLASGTPWQMRHANGGAHMTHLTVTYDVMASKRRTARHAIANINRALKDFWREHDRMDPDAQATYEAYLQEKATWKAYCGGHPYATC